MLSVGTGVLLVLTTWFVLTLAVVTSGLVMGTQMAAGRSDAIRRSLWWGLSFAVLVVLSASLAAPLGSTLTVFTVALTVLVLSVPGIVFYRKLPQKEQPKNGSFTSKGLRLWLILPLTLAVVYLALAALGPVTNYDTGLYHLGAIYYQQIYGLVPGLANLYFPLGYGNSVVSLAAALGATPWDLDGFRLLNGFLLSLAATDLVLRLIRRKWSPGTFLLLISMVFLFVPMVALSDYWITSPTSDSSVFVLTTVCVAYLADGLTSKSDKREADLAVALILSWVVVSMRPTMIIFAVVLVALLAASLIGIRLRAQQLILIAVSVLLVISLGTLSIARDRFLSGWFQYPLSIYSFDVPWRADDPVWFRKATLGAARNPEDLWNAAENWAWIPVWLSRAVVQWEFIMATVLILGSGALVMSALIKGVTFPKKPLVLTMLPAVTSVLAWFFASPPYFRFVWGPLFLSCALPGAFGWYAIASSGTISRTVRGGMMVIPATALAGVVAFSSFYRIDIFAITSPKIFTMGPWSVSYAVADVPKAPTQSFTLASGLSVVMPTESDQCWATWPMCTAQIAETVRMRGSGIEEGFTAR